MKPEKIKVIKDIERKFFLSSKDMSKIIHNFHSEMKKGLSNKKSSLKMIPTFARKPSGREKGEFLALDLGGTNFRVLSVKLKGKGKYSTSPVMMSSLNKEHMEKSGKILFTFLAKSIKKFIKKNRMSTSKRYDIGFTFSFPVRQKSISSGMLIKWTKGFKAKGVKGRDVVKLLNDSIKSQELFNTRVVAICNDTVSTFVAKSYEDNKCDAGVILGTGTNACYSEKLTSIHKNGIKGKRSDEMIINMEWGAFDKLKVTDFDVKLDRASKNPGEQQLEKMVSGMYLGKILGFVAKYLMEKRVLAYKNKNFNPNNFKSEYMSIIESDDTKSREKTKGVLTKLGISDSGLEDRKTLKKACKLVSLRAARISASSMIALITKIDPYLLKKHTIAIDGSVYEKHPNFSKNVKMTIKELLGKKAKKIKLSIIKDASGKGAAIVAANA